MRVIQNCLWAAVITSSILFEYAEATPQAAATPRSELEANKMLVKQFYEEVWNKRQCRVRRQGIRR